MNLKEQEKFESYTGFIVRPKTRTIGVLIVHCLAIYAISHLAWVSFFIKTDSNPIPKDILESALLFGLVYLSIFFLWCITISFSKKMPKGTDVNLIINKILFSSIEYTNPFKSHEKNNKALFFNKIPIYIYFITNYYNSSIFGFLILFSFGFYQITSNPSEALITMKILKSNTGFFCANLIIFYGFGSALSVILLKSFCFLLRIYHSFASNQNDKYS